MILAMSAFSAPLTEHEVLVFLVELSLLIGLARTLGGIVRMFGQPAVVGELLAGVMLGPSLFGKVAPKAFEWVFSEQAVQSAIFGFAWLGVIFLLIVIGYETDLGIISRFRRAALAVSAGALAVPLLAAGGASFLVPASFVGVDVDRAVFAGFFALALSVSALPVVAKILSDLGFMRRNFGQITLAAGMTMDAVGWLMLAALSGIAQEGFDPGLLAWSFGGLIFFTLIVVTAGRWFLDGIMRRVLARGSDLTSALTVTVVAALVGAVVTQALRIEAILGAFLIGILLSTLRHQVRQVERTLEVVTASVFAPVFFAFSGLRVDIGLLNSTEAVVWTIGLVVMAILAKIVGTIAGGHLAGIRGREVLALGSGLSALGAMGIVVAIVGLNLGVVSATGYTVLVLAAIVTSLMAPMLLKAAVRGWEVPTEEKQRIERETLLEASEILGSKRILIPTRGGTNSQYAARVIAHVFDDPDITVLAVDVVRSRAQRLAHRVRPGESDPSEVLAELKGMRHRMVRKTATDPAAAIAREARLGYDLVLLGASEQDRDSRGVFSTVVDRVLGSIDIPTIIVRLPGNGVDMPEMPKRILVPIVSSRATRAAEELAYSLLAKTGGRALALHVVDRPEGQGIALDQSAVDSAVRAGQEMVSAAAAFGERLGIVVESGVLVAQHPAVEIVDVANSGSFDLVVIGAVNKPLTNRPFFGHRVTYMIDHSAIPLAVVALPTRT